MFAVVKSEGNIYMPLRNFPRGWSDSRRRGVCSSMFSDIFSGPPCSVRLSLPGDAGMNRLLNRQNGKDRGSSLDAITGLNLDCGIAIEQNIHARTKLDEPNPLAAGYVVSHLKIENDTARDQAGDLLEYYGTAVAFHCDDVLLVLLRRILLHGVEEF